MSCSYLVGFFTLSSQSMKRCQSNDIAVLRIANFFQTQALMTKQSIISGLSTLKMLECLPAFVFCQHADERPFLLVCCCMLSVILVGAMSAVACIQECWREVIPACARLSAPCCRCVTQVRFLNMMNIKAACMGNHDFDFGVEHCKSNSPTDAVHLTSHMHLLRKHSQNVFSLSHPGK